MTRTLAIVAFLAGCSDGGGDGGDAPPIEEYACVHVVEGDLVDVAATREEASEITPGREPYRVNLLPGVAGFLRFQANGEGLVLLTDFAGAASAVWTGEERTPLEPGAPDPHCDEDIPSVQDVPVGAGEHFLELGPIYQANVWLMLGS